MLRSSSTACLANMSTFSFNGGVIAAFSDHDLERQSGYWVKDLKKVKRAGDD
jgi:hypothetical protein